MSGRRRSTTSRWTARVSIGAALLCGACASPTFETHYRAGTGLAAQGRHAEAANELEAAIELSRDAPVEADLLIQALSELADLYRSYPDLQQKQRAEPLLLEARRISSQHRLPPRSRLDVLERLGTLYAEDERFEAAREPLEAYLEVVRRERGAEAAYASNVAMSLAEVYAQLGEREQLEALRQRIASPRAADEAAGGAELATFDAAALYLEPNVRDVDGVGATVHFTKADMPLVVSIGEPPVAALDSTPEATRRVAIDGFRAWERALRRVDGDFALEFRDDDPDAAIRVEWTRRPRAFLPAQGEISYAIVAGALRVRSRIRLSAQPIPGPKHRVSPAELRIHAVHAFGSALGLVDCARCDSMMSLAWLRREEFTPTDLDVRTYEALTRRSNGVREDGQPLAGLGGAALPGISAPPKPGVLADLPFINTGRGDSVNVDIAPAGQRSFVVTLDTGATDTVLTSNYARAMGISVRSAKSDPYVRATAAGIPIRFWVMGQRVVGGGRGPAHFDYALLGGQYLKHFVVELDFARRRVRFLDPTSHRAGDREGEHVVELRISELRPYARLELGRGKVWALVDTGAEVPIAITEEKAAELGIAVDLEADRISHWNVFSTSTSTLQRLPEARLGSLALTDVAVQIAVSDESSVRVARWLVDETLIGTDLLRNFVVRFDYPRSKLGLTPIPRGSSASEDAPPGG